MKRFNPFLGILFFFCVGLVSGQTNPITTPYNVSFKLTYDRATEEYTFWLVPNYSTPNPHNSDAMEREVGVAVTFVVPNEFIMESYTGLLASWAGGAIGDPDPLKLGPGVPEQKGWPLDKIPPNASYYVHSIFPFSEYATFTAGEPIPSFRFKGNGCFGDIRIMEKEDPILPIADEYFQLSLGNYFISNSAREWYRVNNLDDSNSINDYTGNTNLGASCFLQTDVVARADRFQVDAGSSSAKFNVLFNDDKNRIPVIVRDTKLRILDPPSHGRLLITEDQHIQYETYLENIPSFSFQYELCLRSEPSVCDTTTVTVLGTGEAATLVRQCQFEESVLTVPAGWTDVQWFRNGNLVGTSSSFTAREAGRYTVRASNQTCPAEGCLPIEVITEICCPDPIPLPVRTVKTKQ